VDGYHRSVCRGPAPGATRHLHYVTAQTNYNPKWPQ
jgi:hypothetical protein